MRRGKTSLGVFFALVAILSVVVPALNVHASATITTDQSDYMAGTIVIIYGSGFIFGGVVTVSVTDPSNAVQSWSVTADPYGGFATTYQLDHVFGNYLVTATDGTNTATTTFHDANEAANLDQCTNGPVGPPVSPQPCIIGTVGGNTYGNWVNGNSNGAKSHWREGDFIGYRVTATGLTAGAHTLDFHYGTVHGSTHAIDYLGLVNATETFSITPNAFHANDNNPCVDKLTASQCSPSTTNPAGFITVPAASLINCGGSSGTFTSLQIPGKIFIWGPSGTTLDAFTYTTQNVPSGTGQCSTSIELGFHSGSGGSVVVIAWGGHIASQGDWGAGNSASSISGSPYHVALDSLDGTTAGSQERALSSSSIFFTPGVSTIVRDSAGNNITSVAVGTTVHDTATLSGSSSNAAGSATYSLWNTGTCSGTKLSTQTVSVASATIPNSQPFTPTVAGSYSYNITYAGDSLNFMASGACEPFTVVAAASSLTTSVSPSSIILGPSPGSAHDTATLSNGVNPKGTITFTVFDNPTCFGSPVFTGAPVSVNGNGAYLSPAFTPSAVGTYYWIASYSGDSNNNPANGACGANGETLTVQRAGPIVTTSVSPSTITLTTSAYSATDTATLSGGFSPSGTLTFTVFYANAACAGNPVFTSAVLVSGNGNYVSAAFTPPGVGVYNWVASYSGDAYNNPFTAACGAVGETLTVQPASPNIITQVSPSTLTLTTNAGSAADTATLSSGFNPTGTITFAVYSGLTCTGNPILTSVVNVSGNGNYVSAPFTPPSAGTYQWVATYTGDSNDNPFLSQCGATGETLTVQPATPTIVTQVSPSTVILTTSARSVTDAAILSGGFGTPQGAITFSVYSSNQTCAGTPLFTSTVSVNGNGNYASAAFTPAGAGTYNWVAAYSGDANNKAYTAPCGANGETLVVQLASPGIVTQVSPSTVTLQTSAASVTDTASLSGGFGTPRGTITFTVFFTSATCSGSPIFTSTAKVNGNGNYPSAPFTAPGAGTYNWVAIYSGDANNNPYADLCGANGETLIVLPASPTVATSVSPSTTTLTTTAGTATDTATLSGGFGTPVGILTFSVYSANQFCTGGALFTSVVSVNGNGNYASAAFTPSSAGTYNWRVVYSGDANNNQFTAPCGASGETLTVQPANPSITTLVSPSSITLGTSAGSAADTATLSGGFGSPKGTITFTLFPANTNCTGNQLFTSTVTVNGNGHYPSAPFSPTGIGTYQWVASYSGDANNNPYTSQCGEVGETLTVLSASPYIVTSISPSTIASTDSTVDMATLSGGFSPTGTITFTVFPQNTTCTGSPIFTSTVSVNGNGNYVSAPFSAPSIGVYNWVASYSGNLNNNPFTAPCGASGETLTVTIAAPSIVTSATPSVITMAGSNGYTSALSIGWASDTATLSRGFNPSGTITFNAYYANATCSGTPLFTSTVTVNGNGNYASASFIPPAAGTYNWVASYSGDSNNGGYTAPCVVTGEILTINKASPTVTTSVLDPSGKDVTGQTIYQGIPVHDTATVWGGVAPDGNVTYYFYSNGQCSGPSVSSQTFAMFQGSVPGTTPQTLSLGSYSYLAVYSGDANNNNSNGACEPVSVSKVNTTTTTSVFDETSSRAVPLEGWVSTSDVVHDTATVGTQVNGFIINGTSTYYFYTTGDCSGAPSSQTVVTISGGTVPDSAPHGPLIFGSYSFRAIYSGNSNYNGSTSACEPFTTAPPSIVTDTSFCRLPSNQLVLNLITDPKNPSAYRLVSTNPGQFYDNVFYTGSVGSQASLSIRIPFPFETQGAVPIQVSSNVVLVNGCFQPSFDLTSQFSITSSGGHLSSSGSPVVLFTDYNPQQLGSTTTVFLTGPVPSTGLVYVTIHMDYGLRNQDFYKNNTGSSSGPFPVSCSNNPCAQWTTNTAVIIGTPQTYLFSVAGSMSTTTSPASVNNFKKDPGFAGVVTDLNGNPIVGATVNVYDSNGKLVAAGTTDINGVYMISYKYTGSQTWFTIKVSSPLFSSPQTATVTMKSNQMAVTTFIMA